MQNLKNKAQTIFKELERKGWKIYDIQYLDGYFIFEYGKDSVVHFRIKGCKGWKFAIWWYEKEYEVGRKKTECLVWDFFGQYEKYIDKFKPTASTFVIEGNGYEKDGVLPDVSNGIYRADEIISFIHKHPYVARAYECGYRRDSWDYLTPFEAWKSEMVYTLDEKYVNLRKRWYERKYLKILNKVAEELLVDYKIFDENKDGWKCSPRWDLVASGFKDEEVKNGNYRLIEDIEDLSPRLQRKVQRFDKKIKKLCDGRNGYEFYDYEILRTGVWIKKKERQ